MGKVFSPEEIVARQWPQPENHVPAAMFLLDAICDHPFVDGVMVYGSVVQGTADIRSDLDLLIAVESESAADVEDAASHIRQTMRKAVEEFKVSPEPHMVHAHSLVFNTHTIDSLFARNLNTVDPRWVRGEDPRGYLTEGFKSAWDIVREYVAAKERKFGEGLLRATVEVDYRRLQRAYELPVALGRKLVGMLAAQGERLHTLDSTEISPNIEKSQVIRLVRIFCAENPELLDKYEALVRANQDYSRLLEQVIDGQISVEDYRGTISESYLRTIAHAFDLVQHFGTYALAKTDVSPRF